MPRPRYVMLQSSFDGQGRRQGKDEPWGKRKLWVKPCMQRAQTGGKGHCQCENLEKWDCSVRKNAAVLSSWFSRLRFMLEGSYTLQMSFWMGCRSIMNPPELESCLNLCRLSWLHVNRERFRYSECIGGFSTPYKSIMSWLTQVKDLCVLILIRLVWLLVSLSLALWFLMFQSQYCDDQCCCERSNIPLQFAMICLEFSLVSFSETDDTVI